MDLPSLRSALVLSNQAFKYTMEKYNIVAVCKGNACRSPLVEYAIKAMLKEHPELNIEVWSCGTLDWGRNPRDPQMCTTAEALGVTMKGETRHVHRDDLAKADCIVTFTKYLKDELTGIVPFGHWNRIILFDELAFNQKTDVEDPRNMSEAVYARVASHIVEGCRNIVNNWVENPPVPID